MADPRLRSLRGPFALALVLHIVLLILFALNFEASQRSAETAQPDIIEAVVLDDSRIAAEAERLKTEAAPPAETGPEPVSTPNPEESRRAQQIEAEKAAEESRRQMEAKKLADQARKDEQRRKAEAEEKARAAAEAAARKKAEAEAKEKAEAEARRRAAEEARAKAAAEAEAKRRAAEAAREKAEAEAREKAAAEAAARKKAEAEAKEKAEAEARRRAAEEARARAMAEATREMEEEVKAKAAAEARKKAVEDARRKAELEEQLNNERRELAEREANKWANRYIKPRVEGLWLKPSAARGGLFCIIQVRTLGDGTVVEARVVKSSGDAAFDRSAESAVKKASPLPMPSDPRVAAELRSFTFKFEPAG